MRKHLAITAFAIATALASLPAEARPRHHHHSAGPAPIGRSTENRQVDVAARPAYPTGAEPGQEAGKPGPQTLRRRHRGLAPAMDANGSPAAPLRRYGGDPRPRAWCGWWLRHHLGVEDRAGNLARWWARYGTGAHGPEVGAIVVWPHHVGILTGRTETGWIVKSGNDGHAVRERERSLRGAIAFRWPNGLASR